MLADKEDENTERRVPATGQELVRQLIQAFATLMDGQAAYLDTVAEVRVTNLSLLCNPACSPFAQEQSEDMRLPLQH